MIPLAFLLFPERSKTVYFFLTGFLGATGLLLLPAATIGVLDLTPLASFFFAFWASAFFLASAAFSFLLIAIVLIFKRLNN